MKRGAKRFYESVYVGETDDGYSVRLDGKPINLINPEALKKKSG